MIKYLLKDVVNLKKGSIFAKVLILIAISVICVTVTVGIAIFAGSCNTAVFDFKNLNFENMIPVLVIGGFISCVIVGVSVLFVTRSVFLRVKDYLLDERGGDKK